MPKRNKRENKRGKNCKKYEIFKQAQGYREKVCKVNSWKSTSYLCLCKISIKSVKGLALLISYFQHRERASTLIGFFKFWQRSLPNDLALYKISAGLLVGFALKIRFFFFLGSEALFGTTFFIKSCSIWYPIQSSL